MCTLLLCESPLRKMCWSEDFISSAEVFGQFVSVIPQTLMCLTQSNISEVEQYVFWPAAWFAYWKGLGCTDALLTISHHRQESLHAGMDSFLTCRDGLLYSSARLYSAAVDRVSRSGILFKLKSNGVGGSVLSICEEFLSDRPQRVVVDGPTSQWIPIVSGVPQGSVFGPLLFILYTSEMFEQIGTDYMPMQMTLKYWQLSTSQQTDLLLTGTWIGFP